MLTVCLSQQSARLSIKKFQTVILDVEGRERVHCCLDKQHQSGFLLCVCMRVFNTALTVSSHESP